MKCILFALEAQPDVVQGTALWTDSTACSLKYLPCNCSVVSPHSCWSKLFPRVHEFSKIFAFNLQGLGIPFSCSIDRYFGENYTKFLSDIFYFFSNTFLGTFSISVNARTKIMYIEYSCLPGYWLFIWVLILK